METMNTKVNRVPGITIRRVRLQIEFLANQFDWSLSVILIHQYPHTERLYFINKADTQKGLSVNPNRMGRGGAVDHTIRRKI